jgi:hypothetical protein
MSQEVPKLLDQSQTKDISDSGTAMDTGVRAQADTEIGRWLEQFVSTSEGPSAQALRVFYADTVSPYFAMKSASWAEIQRDKETYFKRFPKIRYSIAGTPQFSELGNGDCVVEFTIDYSVMRKDGKVSTGRYHDQVTVRTTDGYLRAVGVEELKDQ